MVSLNYRYTDPYKCTGSQPAGTTSALGGEVSTLCYHLSLSSYHLIICHGVLPSHHLSRCAAISSSVMICMCVCLRYSGGDYSVWYYTESPPHGDHDHMITSSLTQSPNSKIKCENQFHSTQMYYYILTVLLLYWPNMRWVG